MKKTILFLMLVLFLLFSSCSFDPDNIIPPKLNSKVKPIYDQLSELAAINIKWLADHDGWIQVVSIPSPEGIIKFTYQERWTHFTEDSKTCLEEMWIIRRTKNDEDGQLIILTSNGYKGDVIKLRQTVYFNDSTEGINKKPVKCLISDRSMPLNDLNAILKNMQFIQEANYREDIYNGVEVIIIEIHYRGDDTDQLGTPQNAIGKKETFYYDKSTGNRIRLDLAIEYPNEVWSGSTFVDYEFFYFENLPESIQKKFDNSIEELMYYLDL